MLPKSILHPQGETITSARNKLKPSLVSIGIVVTFGTAHAYVKVQSPMRAPRGAPARVILSKKLWKPAIRQASDDQLC